MVSLGNYSFLDSGYVSLRVHSGCYLQDRCIRVCYSMCSCVILLGSSNVYVEDVGVSVACNGLIGKLSLWCPKKVSWLDIDTCSVSLRFHSCCYPHDVVNLEKCRTWLSLKRCLFYHDGFRFKFHLFFAMTRGVKMWTVVSMTRFSDSCHFMGQVRIVLLLLMPFCCLSSSQSLANVNSD